MSLKTTNTLRSRQRGVVLAVGLILLLVMSLIMVVAMSGSILQERMAGSLRNASIAEAGADSALRDGEVWVWNQAIPNGGQIPTTLTQAVGSALAVQFRTNPEWQSGGTAYGAGTGASFSTTDYFAMAQQPAFVVERLGELKDSDGGSPEDGGDTVGRGGGGTEVWEYYRITGRSTGGRDTVVRGAESTFSIVYVK